VGQQYSSIPEKFISFIQQQNLFFVGTATEDSRVNISPKGMDSLRVINENRVVWLNVTGSGNETAAHVQQSPRMTIMFVAFEGAPLILRLYGHAKVIHKNDTQWKELQSLFGDMPGTRQFFDLDIDLVQSSCGMAVPFFDYKEEREQLIDWTRKKGEKGIEDYWHKKNQTSIDGLPTHIIKENI
jgi:hypothetical protein